MSREDWVLVDVTNVCWPGALPWRGADSERGYASREDAERRAAQIREHYNRTFGQGGPDLRVRARNTAEVPS